MSTKVLKLAAAVFLMACMLALLMSRESSSDSETGPASAGETSAQGLLATYEGWEAGYIKNGGDRNLVASLGWLRGLSTEKTPGRGIARLDLIDGKVAVEVAGLSKSEGWDFWLVDNSAESSVIPDSSDQMVRVGELKRAGRILKLEANLGNDAFASFDPDLYVVTPAGRTPIEARALVGTSTLFQRLYRSKQRGQFGVLADAGPANPAVPEKPGLWTRLMESIVPTAHALGEIPEGGGGGTGGTPTPLEQLINKGRLLFLEEQFNGNGRTCASCHREDNNLTIDPAFIATLPANDPLFVAEFNPNLAQNFENPVLMRKVGLILENVDGLDDLPNKFAMRGVPHTLALLQNTLTPAGFDGSTVPPSERTGWSGDGAPVGSFVLGDGAPHQATGSLRDFAIGAVIQHFPLTLNRTPGVDFRLPTNAELDAMEAFQRASGRREDLNLSTLRLKSAAADRGRVLFISTGVFGQPAPGLGRCNLCHLNAGASVDGVANANFNTGVENLPDQPADLLGQPNPPDGGFGTAPNAGGGFGNGTFNVPVVVEAADTGPFFHNNSITTVEGAVAFYNSDAFNNSPSGIVIGGIRMEPTQVEAIAAFMRVINALENIRSSIDLETRARNAKFLNSAVGLLKLSISELEDAVRVLEGGGIHPEAVQKLRKAIELDQQASQTSSRSTRQALIDQAIAQKNGANNDLQF